MVRKSFTPKDFGPNTHSEVVKIITKYQLELGKDTQLICDIMTENWNRGNKTDAELEAIEKMLVAEHKKTLKL